MWLHVEPSKSLQLVIVRFLQNEVSFLKIIQKFELKRVGVTPKGHQLTLLRSSLESNQAI